jgi:hypothetical protein
MHIVTTGCDSLTHSHQGHGVGYVQLIPCELSYCYHHSSCFVSETSVEIMFLKRIVDSVGLVECRDGDRKKLRVITWEGRCRIGSGSSYGSLPDVVTWLSGNTCVWFMATKFWSQEKKILSVLKYCNVIRQNVWYFYSISVISVDGFQKILIGFNRSCIETRIIIIINQETVCAVDIPDAWACHR